jgi:transposase
MGTMCDQPLCQEQATHGYTWEWGQSGAVCARHQVLLQQTAQNLGRTITFAPIDPAATPPITRDERVRLKAESLVLAEELTEAKTRGLEMYRQIELLTAQVQSLTVRNREAEAQLKDLANAREKSEARLVELEVENGDLADELGRLRVLLPPASLEGGEQQRERAPGIGL